jgi:putative ABC transport system ATP-binding protein
MSHAVRIDRVTKRYVLDGGTVCALHDVSLDIPQGDYVAIMGASGSGKSTLLNLLGCLDQPTSGRILLGDEDVTQADDDRRATIRAGSVGFVFQAYNLIPQLTVLENIEVPLYYQNYPEGRSRDIATELAERVGLGDRLDHRPFQLSGGQQQRVAIARALAVDPLIILADEPTGNLDSKSGREILDLFDEVHGQGKTIIMVTHDDPTSERANRVVRLRDGQVEQDVYA